MQVYKVIFNFKPACVVSDMYNVDKVLMLYNVFDEFLQHPSSPLKYVSVNYWTYAAYIPVVPHYSINKYMCKSNTCSFLKQQHVLILVIINFNCDSLYDCLVTTFDIFMSLHIKCCKIQIQTSSAGQHLLFPPKTQLKYGIKKSSKQK